MNDLASAEAAANAAIFYHPEGYDTGRQRLMGRHAAGEGFGGFHIEVHGGLGL